jgi:small ligand-binding sensory domain FIST
LTEAARVVLIHATVGHNFTPHAGGRERRLPKHYCRRLHWRGRYLHSWCQRIDARIGADEHRWARGRGKLPRRVTPSNGRDLAVQAAAELQGKLSGINAILLYTPGMDLACDDILAGIESLFGRRVPVVGGLAADNGKAKTSFLFHGQTIAEHRILMIGLADPALELLSIAHHGHRPIGRPFVVTGAEGSRVLELDGAPAWLTVVRRLGLPDETTPAGAIPLAALGIEIDGTARDSYDNAHIMLVPLRGDDAGGFYLNAHVTAGTKFQLMQRDEERIFAGVERMMPRLKAMIDGREIVAVFHADCLARGRQTFDRVSKDEIIAKLQKPLVGDRDVPWLGLYGYGEFCPLAGNNSLHTFTTSLFPLVRRRAA